MMTQKAYDEGYNRFEWIHKKANGEEFFVDSLKRRAEKLGFTSIVISKYCKLPKTNYSINVIKVAKVHDVVRHLFG